MTAKYTETAYAGNTILAIPQRMCRRHDIPMGYLDRLSEIRKRRGLTQMQIAEQVGVEQPTYQRWESGKREPSFEQLFAVARALDVELGDLFDHDIAVPLGPKWSAD